MGVFLGGSCPCGNFLGRSFPGWELSRWDLSWVRIFFGGSFPGGSFHVTLIETIIEEIVNLSFMRVCSFVFFL